MDLTDNFMKLRIKLDKLCEGFSATNSKDASFTSKIRVLFLLENKDLTPKEIMEEICVVKSNLANLLKTMINENLVISYKNENNSKNINYRITNNGLEELKNFKERLYRNIYAGYDGDILELSKMLGKIIDIIGGNND